MTVVTIQKAQTDLDDLVARAEAGEEITLTRGDEPTVRLVPVETVPLRQRTPGRWRGRFTVPDGVFDPLSDEELRDWEDGPIFPPESPR